MMSFELFVITKCIGLQNFCCICEKFNEPPTIFCIEHRNKYRNSNSRIYPERWAYKEYKKNLIKNSINVWDKK